MRKKLAIVGCAMQTRDLVDYSDPDLDVWVLNESAQKDWCKRADAVIQMHHESIWKSPVNRGDKEHGNWLKSGETPDIYMLEKYPEVPKSIAYPKDEIVQALLPSLVVDSERGRRDYFTSSIAYAFALGIYLGYKEIHTFGVELADEEEYREQKPCAMFWNGVAVGRGVKWVSHSQMFDEPLYPLETYVGLDIKVFSDKVLELEPACKAATAQYEAYKPEVLKAIQRFEESGAGKDEMEATFHKLTELAQKFGVLDGARQENNRYFLRAKAMKETTTTYVFSRHEFVRDQAAIGVKMQNEAIPQWNALATQMQNLVDQIEPKRFDGYRRGLFRQLRLKLDDYIKAGVAVAMYRGAINEDSRFIALVDEERKKMREAEKHDQAN